MQPYQQVLTGLQLSKLPVAGLIDGSESSLSRPTLRSAAVKALIMKNDGRVFPCTGRNELLLIRPLSSVVSVMSFRLVLSYGQSSLWPVMYLHTLLKVDEWKLQ